MRDIDEIIGEKHGMTARMLVDSGIPLKKEEIFYISDKVKEFILEALIELSAGIPRVSEDPTRLHCYNHKSVVGRHIVDGKSRHIAQIFTNNGTVYYTDGKREVNE